MQIIMDRGVPEACLINRALADGVCLPPEHRRVPLLEFLQEARNDAIFERPYQEMPMVVHQTVRDDAHGERFANLGDEPLERVVVLGAVK